MQFVIAGGGEVGLAICKTLLEHGHQVVLIEKDIERVKEFDENLTAQVIAGDVTFFSTLQQIKWETVEAFLAMTQSDAVNVLACKLAKTLGVRRAICRIHLDFQREAVKFNYASHFSLDGTINTQHSCAFSIAKRLRTNHRVMLEQFGQGFVDLRSLSIDANSPLIGQSIVALGLNNDIRIGLIQRGDNYFIPSRDTVLQAGDLLTLAGTSASILEFSKHVNPQPSFVHITLYSGSDVSRAIVLLLQNPRFKIKIIETSLEDCQQLSDTYSKISVVHGDATHLRVLQEEQMQNCDYFIACSNDDEKNIIACLQAKKAGAKHTILWTNKEEYEAVCDALAAKLEVDQIITTQACLWKELQPMLFPQQVVSIDILGDKTDQPVELLEIEIPAGAEVEGLSIDQLSMPCVFLILKHKFRIKVPAAGDILLGGDRIIAAVSRENRDTLIYRLTHKESMA